MRGNHNPFLKHVGGIELWLEERSMTIIRMSMMKGSTQRVAIGEMDGVAELGIRIID